VYAVGKIQAEQNAKFEKWLLIFILTICFCGLVFVVVSGFSNPTWRLN